MTPTDPTRDFQPDPLGPTADAPAPDSALDAGLAAAFGSDDSVGSTADFPGKDEHVGAILAGKYKLIEAIGDGGMGSVYMAQQTEPVKRLVAVKVIKAGMDSKAVLARFEAERQALAMMDHPNIARVLDAGATESGRPFFVMELVKGVPITQFCDDRKLTPPQRLELFVQVCNAIQHAHQKGVIHRDIKPSNVLVALYDDRPVPKVIDFGVAKAAGQTLTENTLVTGFGAVVGTPEYMSPEQASLNNLDIDTRSDVYALGVLLYELLTGSTPVDRKSLGKAALLEVLRIVREVEAPRPSAKLSTSDALPSISANRGTEPKKLTGLLRSELDWIVLKALEKDRARRYETANGFAADVQRYLSGEPVQAHPPSTGYRLKKFVRRNRAQVIAAGLVFAALVAGVVGTALGMREARAQRDIAREETSEKEKARADEEKQRGIAETARDRAAASDAFSRKTIDAIVDAFVSNTQPSGIPKPLNEKERAAKHAAEWERYRDFYEREIADHPTGERHDAAVLRLGLAFAMLARPDDAGRTLDGLLDAMFARLQTDPRQPATVKVLADATELRCRVPLLVNQHDGTPRTLGSQDAVRRESDRLRETHQPRWEALARLAPDVFEYRRQALHNCLAPLARLYADVAKAEQTYERKLLLEQNVGPLTVILPPGLVQQVAAYQDCLCTGFRDALAHFPAAPADAKWLRGAVLETVLRDRGESGVAPVPPAVRDELLVSLFRADLRRSVAAGPQERRPGDNGWKDEMLGDYLERIRKHSEITGSKLIRYRSDAVRAVSTAWQVARKAVPEYPWADVFTPALRTELFVFSRAEAGQGLPPEARAELVAAQRKLLAEVTARPPIYAFHTGVSLQEDLLEKTAGHLKGPDDVPDLIAVLGEWKKAQAAGPQPTPPADLLRRLDRHVARFQGYDLGITPGPQRTQLVPLAAETVREFDGLFDRDRPSAEDPRSLWKYLQVVEFLVNELRRAKREAEAVELSRAALVRAAAIPPANLKKDSTLDHLILRSRRSLTFDIAGSHYSAKQYAEAVAAADEYLKLPPEPGQVDVDPINQLKIRLLRARAVIRLGRPDEATRSATEALQDHLKACKSNGRGHLAGWVSSSAAGFVWELRQAKATKQLDQWAVEVLPLLAELVAAYGENITPKIETRTAELCEQFRELIWESLDRGDTKQAIVYADAVLALKPEILYAARIQMSRARLVALTGDHAAGSKAAQELLEAPNAQYRAIWFLADAALCYAACANACKDDAPLREGYAAEAIRLLRICWTVDQKELPRLANFPEFRPHHARADFRKLKQEIDAKFPPPKERAPPPREVK